MDSLNEKSRRRSIFKANRRDVIPSISNRGARRKTLALEGGEGDRAATEDDARGHRRRYGRGRRAAAERIATYKFLRATNLNMHESEKVGQAEFGR